MTTVRIFFRLSDDDLRGCGKVDRAGQGAPCMIPAGGGAAASERRETRAAKRD